MTKLSGVKQILLVDQKKKRLIFKETQLLAGLTAKKAHADELVDINHIENKIYKKVAYEIFEVVLQRLLPLIDASAIEIRKSVQRTII